MSAKRRQEAIAKFSVPIAEKESVPLTTRKTRRNKDGAAAYDIDAVDDSDSDFAINDDSDNFIEDEDEDKPFAGKKSKSKGKGKAKSFGFSKHSPDFEESDENPRVMLLSLKAVCPFLASDWPNKI